MNQWNRIKGPEIDPHICEQLAFDNDWRQFNVEMTVLSTSGSGTIDM